MVRFIKKRLLPILLAVVMVVCMLPLVAFAATTVEPVTGRIQVTDSVGTGKLSDGTVTITATGGSLSKTTNKITVTNTSGVTGKISFDYTISNQDSYTGFTSTSGSYQKIFAENETDTFTIVSKTLKRTVTLTLTNFGFEEALSNFNLNFAFDSSLGAVSVDGTTISDGQSVEVAPGTVSTLAATPVSGATFLGWINTSDNTILSPNASYSFTAVEDTTIKAVFVNNASAPHFMVEDKYLFDDLAAATAKAASSTSNKTVVLMNNATLPAGNYTIPSGVTLLIPFDAANTCYTTEPGHDEGTTNITPTPYRTLKMASGANIIVNGSISLSAKHREAQGSGNGCENSGAYGCIDMATDSNVTINNGAFLYAYGFIIGDGTVTANSGATVYEYFQFRDFRGGSISTDMEKEYGVFLFSQYYVQNIEVPLTLYAGAIEKTYTSLTIASQDFTEDITFIGSSDAMFTLLDGKVTKRYDGSTDRLIIEADGNVSVSPITLKIGNWATDLVGQSVNINTADYELPITNNLTVIANSGNVTINQDLALLPGSEIIVREAATCTLGEGINIYAYDADDWGTYTFSKSTNYKFLPLNYAPSRTYTRTEADLVDAKIQVDGIVDASFGYVYTTAGGANIFSTENGRVIAKAGTQTVTYQFIQGADYTAESNIAIPITPAKIKNSDGSVLQTATNTYTYTDGFWRCEPHNDVTDWVLDKEPTYSVEGSKHQDCNHCGGCNTEAVPTITVPDIDGDGSLTALDLVKLKKIVLGTDTLPENVYTTISDLNDDKKVNILDLIKIKMYLLEMV